MAVADAGVTPIAEGLLAALEVEIGQVPVPPATVCLRPGDRIELLLATARDECCEGLAWVRVVNFYPSTNFPNQDVTYSPVSPMQWAVVLEVGAARCAPTPDADTIPSAGEWNATAREVFDDAAALRRAIVRFMQSDIDRMCLPGIWTPMTVEGGCVGGSVQVTVAMPACDQPTEV